MYEQIINEIVKTSHDVLEYTLYRGTIVSLGEEIIIICYVLSNLT